MTRADNRVTLVNIRFSLNTCKNLSEKELDDLSDTATNFFLILSKLLATSSNYVIL